MTILTSGNWTFELKCTYWYRSGNQGDYTGFGSAVRLHGKEVIHPNAITNTNLYRDGEVKFELDECSDLPRFFVDTINANQAGYHQDCVDYWVSFALIPYRVYPVNFMMNGLPEGFGSSDADDWTLVVSYGTPLFGIEGTDGSDAISFKLKTTRGELLAFAQSLQEEVARVTREGMAKLTDETNSE